MTVNIRATEAITTAEPLDILALYRTMVTARVMNDLLKVRKTQGKFPFYIGCAGHESMAAVTAALNPDDWNYHRQAWSFTPQDAGRKWLEKFLKQTDRYYPKLELKPKGG